MMVDGTPEISMPRASWAAYERQLYEAGISDASRYEQILTTVRELADGLRHLETLEQLDAAWRDATQANAVKITPSTLLCPKEQLLGAAFAIHERKIRERHAHRAIVKRIADARGSGHSWVTLKETGNLEIGSDARYQSIEMHLQSGLALISMGQWDPLEGAVVFVVTIARLDATSGEPIAIEPSLEIWKEYKAREEFLEARAALRNWIDARNDDAGNQLCSDWRR